jgi:hypothetical protein
MWHLVFHIKAGTGQEWLKIGCLGTYFGLTEREVRGCYRKMHNDYHHDLRYSPTMILVMKSQEMR